MNTKKPACTEYLLHIARSVRRNPTNTPPGKNSGVGLHRIYAIAREHYTDEQIHEAVATLLSDGTILVTCKSYTAERGRKGERNKTTSTQLTLLEKVPITLLSTDSRLSLDMGERVANDETAQKWTTYYNIQLHVVNDGLCSKAEHLFETKGQLKLSDRLLESIPAAGTPSTVKKGLWVVVMNANGLLFSSEPVSKHQADQIRGCLDQRTVTFHKLSS